MCILNDITDYSITWTKLIKENIVYPDTYHKIKKYRTFLSYDFKQYKQKLIELCST